MPCFHKFNEYLQLENLDFEPTTLIVGTFNPQWPENNYAQWFYGRINKNHFWNVLPRIYNEQSLIDANIQQWKYFCHRKLIAITDLISCIKDADINNNQHNKWLQNYSDNNIAKQFQRHVFVNIIGLLEEHPTISNIYLTRGISEQFWENIWAQIKDFCNQNGKRCEELLTPSANARFLQSKYNEQNPNNKKILPDFILMRWKEKWHEL